jgi:uncharacterized membrane protein
MRLIEKVQIEAPCEVVWDYIADPDNYPDFMVGLSRWEVVGKQRNGLGARYRVLIHVGAADVGGLVEIVEWKPGRDIALNSVTGVDQRARWRLRETGEDRTRAEFHYAYGVAGGGLAGLVAERLASRQLRGYLRGTLGNLKRIVEGEPAAASKAPAAGRTTP